MATAAPISHRRRCWQHVQRCRAARPRRVVGRLGLTRGAYALDLRQFVAWCQSHDLRLFDVRRAEIECFARHLEELGPSSGTVARRLSTVAGFYRYAEPDGLLDRCPAVQRPPPPPRLRVPRHRTGPQRGRRPPRSRRPRTPRPAKHALISLLAPNGLRVSEALGANIDALGLERGHRTLTVARKGGKIVTIPLAPRTTRAIDVAMGERLEGPVFVDAHGERLDRHAAGRIVRRLARRAGINKPVGSHTPSGTPSSPPPSSVGVPLRDVQEAASHADPRTTMRYDRARVSLDRHATYIVAAFIAGAAR